MTRLLKQHSVSKFSVVQAGFVAMLFVSIAVVASCKPQLVGESEVKHDFGKTRNENGTAMGDCTGTEYKKIVPKDSVADRYINKLLDHITGANQKNTFYGVFARSKFCLRIEMGAEIGALANPENGLITFNVGSITRSGNDADIAGIMSHELAHISMQHKFGQKHPRVRDHDGWRKIQARRDQIEGQQNSLLDQIRDSQQEIADLSRKIPADAPAEAREILAEIQKMQGTVMGFPLDADGDGRGDAQWAARIKKLNELEASLAKFRAPETTRRIKVLEKELAGLNKKQEALEKVYSGTHKDEATLLQELGLSRQELRNWYEAEADEVGFELYLRSGFRADRFAWFAKNILGDRVPIEILDDDFSGGTGPQPAIAPGLHLTGEASTSDGGSKESELQACLKVLAAGNAPERGLSTHPALCWRIFNIEKTESDAHKKDYEPLIRRSQNLDVVKEPTLAEAQEFLKKSLENLDNEGQGWGDDDDDLVIPDGDPFDPPPDTAPGGGATDPIPTPPPVSTTSPAVPPVPVPGGGSGG